MSATDAPLALTREGGIGLLRLNRAGKRNALNRAMLQAWPALLAEAVAEESLRVLIVTGGAGVAFSGGADLDEMAVLATDQAARELFCRHFAEAQTAMADFPKPSIAMISGACVGGGCGLALGCDLRIADGTAKFGITPAKLGLAYSVADTKRLVDAVGFAHAADLLFSGRLIGAEEAQRLGLVSRVVEPAALYGETLEVARAISANAPSSLRSIKATLRAIRAGKSADDDATRHAFADAFEGADFAEGLAAFFERRKPRFE